MGKEGHPKFSIVMPTLNAGQRIAPTIESLNSQDYEAVELILVDAGSRDRTIDVVQRGYRGKVRVYSVTDYNVAEMYNRGISLATGDYVSLLLPPDAYVSLGTLSHMAEFIVKEGHPDLAYCGCLIREVLSEPRVLMRPLSIDWLKRGKAPTSLQSCWYKVETLRRIGKFNSHYRIRGGYELLCRFALYHGLSAAMTSRVYVDHDRTHLGPRQLWRRVLETQRIIGHHFGWRARLGWLLGQHPFRFITLWWRSRRQSFR